MIEDWSPRKSATAAGVIRVSRGFDSTLLSVRYPAALGLIPYNHSQRAKTPSTCTPHAQARLLNIDSAIVFHHSSSAPTSRARGHNATYFGIDTIDRPATTSGTVTHHATPAVAAALATRSSQNSGARNARRNVRDSWSSSSLIALNPTLQLPFPEEFLPQHPPKSKSTQQPPTHGALLQVQSQP